ncbi:hypothetical protein [Streptomyces sp. C10-9-1]|uniref:hypothetical protein n=1 Tax=Streptomyces sp. C10-9-1 TaxID=1859285 RepID=UPI003F4A57CF
MHRFTVNYRDRDGRRRGTLLNRGYFLTGLPRPLLLCRLLGHTPVVDGTTGFRADDPGSRWVCCDRCGTRPNPQGHLDPSRWDIGDRYTGPWNDSPPPPPTRADIETAARIGRLPRPREHPGPWPPCREGALGAQLILGTSFSGWSLGLKLGNQGSEHTLAAHIRLHPLGALYLHTERFGTWLQRRFNPTGYHSRVIELDLSLGELRWKLWARRDERSTSDPWWMHGRIPLDPRDRLLGRRRYDYEDIGTPVTATVRMPHGDDHDVTLKLQRCTDGRNKRRFHSWTADWTCNGGIPTKPHSRGGVWGSAVEVPAQAVTDGTWPTEATARIALQLTGDRTRHGYQPATDPAARD